MADDWLRTKWHVNLKRVPNVVFLGELLFNNANAAYFPHAGVVAQRPAATHAQEN